MDAVDTELDCFRLAEIKQIGVVKRISISSSFDGADIQIPYDAPRCAGEILPFNFREIELCWEKDWWSIWRKNIEEV
jgi:hypothetical protein